MSWYQLKAIVDEAKEIKALEKQEPPAACPFDGTPLESGPGGVLNCPMGDYRYTGGQRII